MDKKLKIVIIFAVILTAFGLLFLVLRSDQSLIEQNEIIEEGIDVSEELNSIDNISEIGDNLVELRESFGSEIVNEDFFDKYNTIEDKFFKLRDYYFGEEKSEAELKNEIDVLLNEIKNLEEEIKNVENNN